MSYAPLSISPAPTPAPAPVATGKGYTPLSSGSPAPTPTASPAPQASGYQPISSVGLIAPKAPVAPVSVPATAPTPAESTPGSTPSGIPASALEGSLGGGYGTSNITDPSSGKPLLTYENQAAKSSQLLSDRTAPPFDPTVPQKIDSSVLQNGRMPESVSQAIKAQFPGSTADELDHIMPLELGGSNNKSNLRLEPGDNPNAPYSPSTNPTATDPLENELASKVQNGQISLVDAWRLMAAAKEVPLPEQGGAIPSNSTIQPDYQTTPAAQSSAPTLLDKVTGAIKNTTENLITNFAPVQFLAKVTGGESILSAIKDVYGDPNKLTADDINNIIARRSQLISSGTQPIAATKQATQEVTSSKIKGQVISNVMPEGDLVTGLGDDVISQLAKETDPVKIASILTQKGIDAEGAQSIAPILSKASTNQQVKAVLTTAAENGLIYGAKTAGSSAAEEYAAQEGATEKAGPAALPEPVKNFAGETNPGLTPEQSQEIAKSTEQGTAAATAKEETSQAAIQAHNEMAERSAAAPPVPQDSLLQKLKNIINPLKQQDPATQAIFKDYTTKIANARQLANDEAKKLTNIPAEQGWDSILRYERGSPAAYSPQIKDEFNSLRAEGNQRGLEIPETKNNYVPHVYSETPDQIKQVMHSYLVKKGVPTAEIDAFINEGQKIPDTTAKRLGLNPSFSHSRTFPTYDAAMEAGLHPKYTHPAQLAGYYRETMERNIANRELVQDLVKKGKLFTADLAPKGYKPVNLEFSQQGYVAKPRLAQMLNGLFHDANSTTFMQRVAGITGNVSKTLQKIVLTAGVPGTDINVHGIGQLIEGITAGDFSRIGTFIRSNSDKASVAFFEKNADVLKRMAANNIDVGRSVADYANMYPNLLKPGVADAYARGGAKSVAAYITKETGTAFNTVFTKKNFASFIPQLQVQTFKDASQRFVAQGMDPKAADALAADVVRAFHGLIGNVGRAKATEDGLSTAFFAPKFRESIVNTLWNSLKSGTTEIKNPAFYKNRRLLAGMALTYGLYAAANKYFSGHWIWENPSTHQFDLQIPTGGGNYVYIPFMPSFLAVPRNLIGGVLSTAQGDFQGATQQFSSELSEPLQLFGQMYANKDFFGNPIYKTTDSGAVKAQKLASYLGLNAVPPFIAQAVKYIQNQGKTPLYQSVTQGMELPIKYGSDATNNTTDYYNAVANYNTMHAAAIAAFKPTFDQIQQLIQSGQTAQAQKLVDGLSDSDYVLFKDSKAGATRSATTKAEAQFLPTYRQIQALATQGQTSQANSMLNGLSAAQYKLYQSLKKKNAQ